MGIINKKSVFAFVVVLLVSGSAFSYGILVGRFKAFPYHDLREVWFTAVESFGGEIASPVEEIASSGEGNFSAKTEWLEMEGRKYNITGRNDLHGRGGGLTKINGKIIGIDSKGKFFIYKHGGEISDLNINIDMNYGKFVNYINEKGLPGGSRRWFRVLDIDARNINGNIKIFLFYHYWKEDVNEKISRISVLSLNSIEEISERKGVDTEEWRVIYESNPSISFGKPPYRPMISNHTGGRIYIKNRNTILASLGDHHMNGIDHEVGPVSQDDTSSFGKILRINIESGRSDVLAKGVRNPQGLYIDDEGRIWETEHGPYGGDELNLIEEGKNYGWPYVTYGRSEGGEWPHEVRTHNEYVRPVYVFEPRTGISNLIEVNERPAPWDGDLLVSSLAGLKLFRIRVRENRVVHVEPIEVGERIRDLVQTEEGSFVLFADNARFIELWPSDSEHSPTDTPGRAAE